MEFFASCPTGFEDALADELNALGLAQVRKLKGRVSFTGQVIDGERACLWSRLASRIRESGREVLGFGEKKTPKPFIKSCDKFIYVEILGQTPPEKAAPAKKKADAKRSAGAEAPVGPAAETAGEKKPSPDAGHASTIIRPFDDEFRTLLENTIDDAADDSGWASLGDVGSVLSKKMPDFDPRNYGYKKLSLLVRALSDAVDMKTEQQRVYVRNRVG